MAHDEVLFIPLELQGLAIILAIKVVDSHFRGPNSDALSDRATQAVKVLMEYDLKVGLGLTRITDVS